MKNPIVKNKTNRILFTLLFLGLIATSVSADTVELVTYYPTESNGQFDRNHARRSTVGSAYSPDTITDAAVPDGTLLVSERLGIGITAPQFPLDIYRSADEAYLRVMGVGNGLAPENFAGIELDSDLPVNGVPDYKWQLVHKRGGAGGENDFHITFYDPTIPAWRVWLAIRKNGNVGIGNVPFPDEKLQVNGNIRMPNTFVDGLGVATAGVIYSDTTRFIHNFGSNNTFMGVESGNFTTAGTGFNSGYGQRTLMNVTTGFFNAAVGAGSLTSNTVGSDNTAVGTSSLTSNNTGNNNVAVGYQALLSNISGSNNVAVGTQAGGNAGGNQNIFIGVQAGLNEAGNDKLYIENSSSANPLIYGDFSTDTVRINNHLGIGTSVVGGTNALAIANGIEPATNPAGQIQLFAKNVSGTSKLWVIDGAGFSSTISPHNFSLIPSGASEPLAWAFYSERAGHAVNVDMLRAIRVLENLSGEQLVYLKNLRTHQDESSRLTSPVVPSLEKEIQQLKADNEKLQKQVDDLKRSVDALARNSRR